MRVFTRSGILGAALAGSMVAGAASAAVIDFTDNTIYSSQTTAAATGSAAGVGFTITGSAPGLTYTPGPGPVGGLAGDNDGIGIGNDEIGGTEYLTVTFDREVKLTGVFFLDLFRAQNGGLAETALVYAGTPPAPTGFLAAFDATETYAPGGLGFGSFAVSGKGTTFSFDVGPGNDAVGIGDFALAGVEIAPIPLPAAGLLLGTALVGVGLARRRRG